LQITLVFPDSTKKKEEKKRENLRGKMEKEMEKRQGNTYHYQVQHKPQ